MPAIVEILIAAKPGHFTERYAKNWQLMIMVPLAGPGVAFAIIWRESLLRVWGSPVGTA
jgi:hypothetical protein